MIDLKISGIMRDDLYESYVDYTQRDGRISRKVRERMTVRVKDVVIDKMNGCVRV